MCLFSTPGFLTRSGLDWLAFESFNLGKSCALGASLFSGWCVLHYGPFFYGILRFFFSPS